MRSMVAFLVLTIAQVAPSLPVPALAAPNDFRVVSGTLLHPARLGPDAAVAVLKSDEGTVCYADLRAVSRIPTVERGAAVTLVGFEGSRPDQLAAQVIYPPEGTPAPADAPLVRLQRIHGRIESLAGAPRGRPGGCAASRLSALPAARWRRPPLRRSSRHACIG